MTRDLFEIEGDTGGARSPDDEDRSTILLRVRVQPGAGRSAVTGRHGDSLKVKVAAPPVDGRANRACTDLVAEVLGVAATQVEMARGQRGRAKTLRVRNVQPDEVRTLLNRAIDAAGTAAGPHRRRR